MDRRAEWTTAALAALMLSVLAPLGLASSEAADQAAQALGVRRSFVQQSPVADVFSRVAVLLPWGEVGARPHAVAAAFGALALALLVARLRLSSPMAAAITDTRRALSDGGLAIAVAVGVAVVGISRPFLEVATLRPALAADFAFFVGLGTLLAMLRRNPARSSLGLVMAFVSGLAAGTGAPVRVATWPFGLALTIWALRRGARWPLLAPLLFVAGTAVVLGAIASADPGEAHGVRLLWDRFVPVAPGSRDGVEAAFAATVRGVSDDAGMLVALVALLGGFLLAVRAPASTMVSSGASALAILAAWADHDILFARLVLMVSLAAPIRTGCEYLTRAFGRARVPAAIVVAVVVVLPPAIVGVGAACRHPAWRSPAAVARRLDVVAATASSPISEPPPEGQAAPWLRYVRAVRGLPSSDVR